MMERVRTGFGQLREMIRPGHAPETGNGQPTIALVGNSTIAGDQTSAAPGVRIPQPVEFEHALYQVTLPPGASLPAGIAYTSLIVYVMSGEVQIGSPGTSITRSLAPQIRTIPERVAPLQPAERPVLTPVPLVSGALLKAGQSSQSLKEEVGITNHGATTATLMLSVVLGSEEMNDTLCFICPKVRTSV